MSQTTGIEWTDRSSNPLRYRDASGADVWACVKKSTGCAHCYSETLALRYGKGKAFTAANMRELTPYVREKELKELLSPKKTPPGAKVFVGDMTDLFGDWVPLELVDRVFAAFALRPDVVFQVLTKRPERMVAHLSDAEASKSVSVAVCELLGDGPQLDHLEDIFAKEVLWVFDGERLRSNGLKTWPLPNVWLGTSVENQATADQRIPHLLKVPARVRFLSMEPLLGPVNLFGLTGSGAALAYQRACVQEQIHWVIVGGESGADSRTFRTEWARDIVRQCQGAGVPVFVKQLGENATTTLPDGEVWPGHGPTTPPAFSGDGFGNYQILGLKSKKGGDPAEWPADLRVRQFPESPQC